MQDGGGNGAVVSEQIVIRGVPSKASEEGFVVDTMEGIERQLGDDIIKQAKTTIERLVSQLDSGNCARVLRMIETVAEHHREMVASLGLGDDILKRRKKKMPSWAGDPLDMYEGGIGSGMDSETFGAQAVQQIGSTIAGAMGKPYEGRNVESLTNALATAEESKLGQDLVAALRAKLTSMLGGGTDGHEEQNEHDAG
jgi:hypothetical protein